MLVHARRQLELLLAAALRFVFKRHHQVVVIVQRVPLQVLTVLHQQIVEHVILEPLQGRAPQHLHQVVVARALQVHLVLEVVEAVLRLVVEDHVVVAHAVKRLVTFFNLKIKL